MFRILLGIFVCLLLPGMAAMGYSLWEGPAAWAVDGRVFWGTPVSLFVFWIGIAHAGTLISAIFLVLDIRLKRRTSMLAELSTLCALAVALFFPLMHLGVIPNFYMVAPFADARGCLANIRSPLVWDLCCIIAYTVLSVVYFVIHACSDRSPSIAKLRRPMAWLLFPLVLWVHTIISLDFANTFVPEWRGAFFPVYFVTGAIFSGLAMVNILLCAESYRVRLLERLMLVCSWFLGGILLWNFALKGSFDVSVFVFAILIPQLLFVRAVRETFVARLLVYISIVFGLFLERLFLVFPAGVVDFGWLDLGLICFGLGLFSVAFLLARVKLSHVIEGQEVLMGEEEEEKNPPVWNKFLYFPPLTTPEFHSLRLPVLVGIAVCLLFIIWVVSSWTADGIEFTEVNIIPLVFPVLATVACFVLCVRPFVTEIIAKWSARTKVVAVVLALVAGALAGVAYAGVGSAPSEKHVSSSGDILDDSMPKAKAVFEARCAGCHGADGNMNEKFIREFYPVPQTLDLARLDSIGEDSLVNVVLQGRVNMNPYNTRLSPQVARSLVRYMHLLAEEKQNGEGREK